MNLKKSMAFAITLLFATAAVSAATSEPTTEPTTESVSPTLNVISMFPATAADGVCADTPLRIVFASAPAMGKAGKIRIFDAANDMPVETIDVSSPTATQTIGGLSNYKYYPVIIGGNEAAIYPHNGALSYGKTYYVTIDPGTFKDASGIYGGITNSADWRFTTKKSGPAVGTNKLTVAADGTGDFCTIQGAVDFVPDGNKEPTTLLIRKGLYTEMVAFSNKHAMTFQGEDRKQTVLAYADNAKFNGAPGTYRRGVFLANRCDDLVLTNLTIRNTTPYRGSQAEAIILNGTPQARAIVTGVDLYSFQDTLQINGQAYISNCYIEGDVDFMWGKGPCFFENCECKAVHSKGYYTQIRNTDANHGYVYYHCTFDSAPEVANVFLARIDPRRFPNSEVVLMDCVLDEATSPIAWLLNGGEDAPDLHFWEFNSHDASGGPVDTSQRLGASKQLKHPDDDAVIANYSNPSFVLGGDWNPRSAPIFAGGTGATMPATAP
jgi:pectin methylesterase-like acyl-CoA thioesterase